MNFAKKVLAANWPEWEIVGDAEIGIYAGLCFRKCSLQCKEISRNNRSDNNSKSLNNSIGNPKIKLYRLVLIKSRRTHSEDTNVSSECVLVC